MRVWSRVSNPKSNPLKRIGGKGFKLTREKAFSLLREAGCQESVIRHSLAVEKKAVELAELVKKRGYEVDVELVRLGAILHDIGRSKTHGIKHGIEGGKILRKLGLPKLSKFAENHLGAGIPREEAVKLGLPARDFMPRTIEEKIVTYADKLIEGNQVVEIGQILKRFESELGSTHPAITRLRKLHEEVMRMSRGG